MSILPILTTRAVMQKLVRAGFRYIYTKGSHYFFQHPVTSRITSVPVHGGKNIGRGLLSKIIKQAGLTVRQFIKL
ncbi:MAG: type II toxin-antitoxin system HicA family toxin [Patescibacteria group bacterium]